MKYPTPMFDLFGDQLVELARNVAVRAHEGQERNSGVPYITHPEAVAGLVEPKDPLTEAVAWLHDVVEDTGVTLEDLALLFPGALIQAVGAITRHLPEPHEDYSKYIRRVSGNPIAAAVKRADLIHNLSDHPEGERKQRYTHALKMLEGFVLYAAKEGVWNGHMIDPALFKPLAEAIKKKRGTE